MINFILLVSRQGKTRLAKWFVQMAAKDKVSIIILLLLYDLYYQYYSQEHRES